MFKSPAIAIEPNEILIVIVTNSLRSYEFGWIQLTRNTSVFDATIAMEVTLRIQFNKLVVLVTTQ